MRIFLLLCIWFAVIGGMFRYADYLSAHKMDVQQQVIKNAEPRYTSLREGLSYSLSIVTSFDMKGDSFALKHDGRPTFDALINLNGISLGNRIVEVTRGIPIVLENIHGLRLGLNELYIQMHPPTDEVALSHGFQVCLKANGEEIFKQSVWSEPEEVVSEIIIFIIHENGKENS